MEVIRHHTQEGIRVALLVATGRKWSKLIYIEHPIRVKRIHNKERRNFSEVDATVKNALKTINRMALAFYKRKHKIPKSVRGVL